MCVYCMGLTYKKIRRTSVWKHIVVEVTLYYSISMSNE